MRKQPLTHVTLSLAFALTLAACGGDDPAPGGGPSDNPGTIAATVTITATGLSSASVTIPAGSRVTFQNNDTRGHAPASNPHPTHGSCPAIDQIGTIPGGQSRTSGNFNTAGTCAYHDHDTNADPRYNGTITVQ
jgi:plastocyanin